MLARWMTVKVAVVEVIELFCASVEELLMYVRNQTDSSGLCVYKITFLIAVCKLEFADDFQTPE